MLKKLLYLLLAVVLCASLIGCSSNADQLDKQLDIFVSDYESGYTPTSDDELSVLDTLDMILDQYVSGLEKPDFDDIQQTVIDPDDSDSTEHFKDVSNNCKTIDEMKAVIIKALSETASVAEFYIDASVYTNEILYDVVFNQICEEYMIETLGMQRYSTITMNTAQNTVAVKITFSYFDDKYSLDEVKNMKKQTLAAAKEVIRELDLANKDTYGKIIAVNQYLCETCVYPEKEPYSKESHSPYGALIEKSAVCEGYARAAQLIFSLCEVESYYVTGDTSAGGHAWNMVKIDNEFYHLDSTWNDVDSQPNMYLLVTDDFMSLSRTWNRNKYPASAKKAYSK